MENPAYELKPFQKVLVRDADNCMWYNQLFGYTRQDDEFPFVCLSGGRYAQCIPYEGNEHLLGTNYKPSSPEPDLKWGDHIEVRDSIDDTWHKAIYVGPAPAGGYTCRAVLVNHHAITLWAFFRPSNW